MKNRQIKGKFLNLFANLFRLPNLIFLIELFTFLLSKYCRLEIFSKIMLKIQIPVLTISRRFHGLIILLVVLQNVLLEYRHALLIFKLKLIFSSVKIVFPEFV